MRSESDRKQSRRRPAEEEREWICEETACKAERARDVAAPEHRDSLHRERAGEKHRKKYQYNPHELALERGASRGVAAIALGQVRVE